MQRASLLLLLLACAGSPYTPRIAHAEDEGGQAGSTPSAEVQAAQRVHTAVEAGDEAALERLAARDSPDPWLIADVLVRGGRADSAAAFAGAVRGPAVAALPAYVAAQRSRPEDDRAQKEWAALSLAFAAGDWAAAVAAAKKAEGGEDPLDSVLRVRCAYLHGIALLRAGQVESGTERLLASAQASRALGWIGAAIGYFGEGARSAYQRSDFGTALEALRVCRDLQLELGQKINAARTLGTIGLVHEKRGEYKQALAAQREALAALRTAGDEAGVAGTLGNLGILHMQRGDYEDALRVLGEALAFWQKHGVARNVATTLGRIALVQEKQDDYAGALKAQRRVLAFQAEVGDTAAATRTRANIGNLLTRLGDYPAAMRIQEEVLQAKRARADRAGEALTLSNLGVIYWSLCDYPRALQMHRRALTLRHAVEDRRGEANSLANIGVTQLELGDYAASLASLESALVLQKSIGDREGAATTSGNIGRLYTDIGEHPKALQMLWRTLDLWKSLGKRTGQGWTLNHLGQVMERQADFEQALDVQKRALALWNQVGHDPGAVFTRSLLGVLWRELGRYPEAVAVLREVIERAAALPNRDLVAQARGDLGLTYLRMGNEQEALALLESAVREARELHMTPVLVRFLGELARLRLDSQDARGALSEARKAVRELEDILGGLGEEGGAAARARHADVFSVGALAAARLGEVEAAFTLLESGRAGSLLESLRGRRALLWADLPSNLREDEAKAKAEESRARHAVARTAGDSTLAKARAAAKRLDRARESVRQVSERIQREAKRQAGIFYPRATTIERLRRHLASDAAFVLFGLCLDEGIALVITPTEARVVSLGPVAALEAACAASDWQEDPDEKPDVPLAELRRLLVEPLKLAPTIRSLLISPDGPLCYIPHGLLFEKRTVALVPSGTTYVLLREETPGPSQGVLALGDPLYGDRVDAGAAAIYRAGRRLSPLPATRKEVEAVGTVRLLGPDAHERGLRESLALQRRWRAVHLACHGLVDPEHPTLSSLALTQEGAEDGFLTCLEVLRAEIPADLVVLSACRTARGRVYRAEGVVGLMRAFMYAGAPRILCSLWNVDDEATLALMQKFYALWLGPIRADGSHRKGLGAAAALRAAQAFVRNHPDHPEWRQPYFWAAWVLWGLPD